MNEAKPVIEAEFVEVKPRAPAAAPIGYGRRTTAGDAPPTVAEAAADLLETSAPLIDAAGDVAEAVGVENGAERAKKVADTVRAGAEVARAVPVAVAAIRRDVEPVRGALRRLVDAAKRSGVIGERRAPVDFEKVQREPKGGR